MKRLLDVSNNNGKVDWPKIKRDGFAGAYLKVTEGPRFVDSYFRENYVQASKLGLRVGGYHFGHPSNSPGEEAANFLAHLRIHPGDLRPVLDIEVTDGQSAKWIERWSRAWLVYVEKHVGVKPLIYSGDSFARSNLGSLTHDYPVWVASYGARPTIPWAAWQYTASGRERLDESVVPNLSELLYKPTLTRKVVKKVKRPLVPMLKARAAYRLLNPL